MGRTPMINKTNFIKALEGTAGVMLSIANHLGVSRNAVYDFCNKYPEMMRLRHLEEEKILDIAENGLFTRTKDKDPWAIKYLLSTKGKKRGYVEKSEIEHSGEIDNNIDLSIITMCQEYNEANSGNSKGSKHSNKK